MREVFTHQDSAKVGYYKSILDEAGIASFIRNQHSNNSLTDMPSPLFFPVLCVLTDDDYEQAMRILAEIHHAPPSSTPDWRCAKCGEEVPGTFDSCWKCGGERS